MVKRGVDGAGKRQACVVRGCGCRSSRAFRLSHTCIVFPRIWFGQNRPLRSGNLGEANLDHVRLGCGWLIRDVDGACPSPLAAVLWEYKRRVMSSPWRRSLSASRAHSPSLDVIVLTSFPPFSLQPPPHCGSSWHLPLCGSGYRRLSSTSRSKPSLSLPSSLKDTTRE